MKSIHDYIILIGFKHVGKTVIGRELGHCLELPFVDLDQEVESLFANEHEEKMTCRQVMNAYGQSYFRNLEKRSLAQIVQSRPCVLSLGGGTLEDKENKNIILNSTTEFRIIKTSTVIHIEASRDVVFNRIMGGGHPAFFSVAESALTTFNRLWDERNEIYKKLASFSITNNGLIDSAVKLILKNLFIN